MAAYSAVGRGDMVAVRAAPRAVSGAWSGGGVPAMERREAAAHHGPDGFLGALGATAELAGSAV